MDFAPRRTDRELHRPRWPFVDEHAQPAEPVLRRAGRGPIRGRLALRPGVLDRAAGRGAPGRVCGTCSCPASVGAGLSNLHYAPIAEVTGWSLRLAPEALNCCAPDTGNMELLNDFGTPEQQRAVAGTPAGRRRSARLLHDGAGRGLLRRHQHRHPDPARRRLVRGQRPKVVVDRRDEPGCGDLHRDGQDRPGGAAGTASSR